MNEPLQSERDGYQEPHPDRALYEPLAGDGERAAITGSWFHRTAPGAVPPAVTAPSGAAPPPGPDENRAAGSRRIPYIGTDARLVPEPEKPAAPRKAPVPVRHLTDDEISYFIAHDPGIFLDEDFHRFMEFDRAIDREMEIE